MDRKRNAKEERRETRNNKVVGKRERSLQENDLLHLKSITGSEERLLNTDFTYASINRTMIFGRRSEKRERDNNKERGKEWRERRIVRL